MSDELKDLREKALEATTVDPLGEAEKVTGVSYKEDEATSALGMLFNLEKQGRVRALMTEIGDTHMRIGWADFLDIVLDYGFEILKLETFAYTAFGETEYPWHLIAAHPEKKLLLTATSFEWPDSGERTLNGGTVYGSILNSEDEDCAPWRVLSGCSHGASTPDRSRVHFSYDVRQGLISKLMGIEEASGGFVDWKDPDTFLWLMDYQEKRDLDNDVREPYGEEYWRKSRNAFLSTSPRWVKKFVGYTPLLRAKMHYKIFRTRLRNERRSVRVFENRVRRFKNGTTETLGSVATMILSRFLLSPITDAIREGHTLGLTPHDGMYQKVALAKEGTKEGHVVEMSALFEDALLDIRAYLLDLATPSRSDKRGWLRLFKSFPTRWIGENGLLVVAYDPVRTVFVCNLIETRHFSVPADLEARVLETGEVEAWQDPRGFSYEVGRQPSRYTDSYFLQLTLILEEVPGLDLRDGARPMKVTFHGRSRTFWGAIRAARRNVAKDQYTSIT